MNENKRLMIVGAIILALVVLILAISFWPKPDKTFACGVKADGDYKKLGAINYKQYQCLMEEKSKNALVVTSKMTNDKKKAINDVAKSISHAIYYVDTDKVKADELKTIKKELKYQDKSFKEDVILVIEKGKVEDYKEKVLTDKDSMKEFLNDADIAKYACGVTPGGEYENLAEIDVEQYQCLLGGDAPFAVIISQTTCGYCKKFKPVIDEYVGENDLPLYVIEVNELEEEDKATLMSSVSYFDENDSWGTPLTLGIKDKEVVATIGGFTDNTDEIEDFFTKLGLK